MSDPRPNALPPLSGVAPGKVPAWDHAHLVHRACPVCGADHPAPLCVRPDRLTVSRCEACAMTYLADTPSEEDLARFYRDYSSFKGLRPSRPAWWRQLLPGHSSSFLGVLLDTGGVHGRSVCEIGCSYGDFLLECRGEGASVLGIEVDEAALQHLRKRGIPAHPSLPDGARCDVVCAFQLLEHLVDPGRLVAAIARALPDDGRLLVALPNGADGVRVGPAWIGYRVDLEHLNYFDIASLSRLFAAHGLYTEHYWEYMQPVLPRAGARWAGSLEALFGRMIAVLHGQPHVLQGGYVLAAMARKAGA